MAEKFLEAFERFFLDLVGTLVPGTLLLGGWALLRTGGLTYGGRFSAASDWWFLLPLAYATGHALTALGEWILVPSWKKLFEISWLRSMLAPAAYVSADELSKRATLIAVRNAIPEFQSLDLTSPRDVSQIRNLAMTALATESRTTIIRFTALALTALGVATIVFTLGGFAVYQAAVAVDVGSVLGLVVLALALGTAMMRRYFEFISRSRYLPFDMLDASLNASRLRWTSRTAND